GGEVLVCCIREHSRGNAEEQSKTMTLARQVASAVFLIALTLWIQCAGMALLIHRARIHLSRGIRELTPWRGAVVLVRFTLLMFAMHLLEILFWAVFYRWHGLSSLATGFYFSASSYSTVGYADVNLPGPWRSLAPIESIMGVIMCGMSVSALLAIAT